ncbi:hypothetical protein C0992_007778 [Termitomyces sp. T32_za158]|nr:hypothetical protein C0992_007778 [Termitomyces sp. T32_za158]
MARSYQNDVVDDSEPEREELRLQERCERKRGLKDRIQYQNFKDPLAVADLHDNNFTNGQGHTNASSSKVSLELTNIPLPQGTSGRDTHTTDNIQNNTEEDELKISLARFAYPGTMAMKKSSITSTRLSRQASASGSVGESQLPAKKLTHRFAAHFSDSNLKKVMKCVSCDISWTTRKGVTQKMIHIQSCAKKKGLTDETVQVLLRKEIESYVADSASHRSKETGESVDPQTLFEGVVAETAPKKKARRKEVLETVKTISRTRDTILERARAIIMTTSSSGHNDGQDSSLHTQILGASGSHDNNTLPPPTQAFGNSALAQARQTTRKLFDCDVESLDTESCLGGTPSDSSTFAPSRLGSHLSPRRPLDLSANVCE